MISKDDNINDKIKKYLKTELPNKEKLVATDDWNIHFTSIVKDKNNLDQVSLEKLKDLNVQDILWLRSYFFDYYIDMVNNRDKYMYLGRITRDFQSIFIVEIDSNHSKARIIPVEYSYPPSFSH